MITYFLVEIIAWFLDLLSWIFGSLLFWAFPPGVAGAIAWMFAPLQYFGGFIDLHFLGSMIVSFIGFEIIWWSYIILRFAFSAFTSAAHGGLLEHPEL